MRLRPWMHNQTCDTSGTGGDTGPSSWLSICWFSQLKIKQVFGGRTPEEEIKVKSTLSEQALWDGCEVRTPLTKWPHTHVTSWIHVYGWLLNHVMSALECVSEVWLLTVWRVYWSVEVMGALKHIDCDSGSRGHQFRCNKLLCVRVKTKSRESNQINFMQKYHSFMVLRYWNYSSCNVTCQMWNVFSFEVFYFYILT